MDIPADLCFLQAQEKEVILPPRHKDFHEEHQDSFKTTFVNFVLYFLSAFVVK